MKTKKLNKTMKKEKEIKYPDDFINKVICGDCLKIMKTMEANSVDIIIADSCICFMDMLYLIYEKIYLSSMQKSILQKSL